MGSLAPLGNIKYAYNIVYLSPALGGCTFEKRRYFECIPTYDLDVGMPPTHEACPLFLLLRTLRTPCGVDDMM